VYLAGAGVGAGAGDGAGTGAGAGGAGAGAGVSGAAWLTDTVFPATVATCDCGLAVGFVETVKVTVPFPLPLADETETAASLVVAVHADGEHPAGAAATVTTCDPPLAPTLNMSGETVNAHSALALTGFAGGSATVFSTGVGRAGLQPANQIDRTTTAAIISRAGVTVFNMTPFLQWMLARSPCREQEGPGAADQPKMACSRSARR
jgi:hypothetical protein